VLAVEVTEVEVIGEIQQDSVDETEVAMIPHGLVFSNGLWRQRGKFGWKRRVLVSGCRTSILGSFLLAAAIKTINLDKILH
jgi:hypothetical protein